MYKMFMKYQGTVVLSTTQSLQLPRSRLFVTGNFHVSFSHTTAFLHLQKEKHIHHQCLPTQVVMNDQFALKDQIKIFKFCLRY